ncbi:MAG: DUF378 domain-containing protein [Parachlamydiales bacterium]|jgi:hypothetical protein
MKKIDLLALILLVVGGLNWGLWGLFDFNIVDYVFGNLWIANLIYFLIGVSAVYFVITWKTLIGCVRKK